MNLNGDLFMGIVLIVAVAFGGALAARLLRAPPLFGYLAAGMIIGPFGVELIDSSEEVSTLAEFGVILLLFGVGVEVSFRDIRKLRTVVVAGGLIQIAVTGVIGFLVGRGLGWEPGQAAVFGMVIALSSTMVALGMMQIGEFSFILASAAVDERIVGQDFLTLVVVSAVVTMALTPPVYAGGSALVERLARRVRALRPYRPGDEAHSEERGLRLRDHVVIVGMGRIGTLVVQALQEHKIPFVCVDLDPAAVARARARGQHALYGSSANEEVLKAARIRQARTLALVTGDPATTYVTVERARELNPTLDIVARVHWREDGKRGSG
ncbi:MAG: hypothetical protein EXR49_03590 [Dehalococcoidia bacterium]|nr:hypothetical protein [Dehalococcoidia bacterium]